MCVINVCDRLNVPGYSWACENVISNVCPGLQCTSLLAFKCECIENWCKTENFIFIDSNGSEFITPVASHEQCVWKFVGIPCSSL